MQAGQGEVGDGGRKQEGNAVAKQGGVRPTCRPWVYSTNCRKHTRHTAWPWLHEHIAPSLGGSPHSSHTAPSSALLLLLLTIRSCYPAARVDAQAETGVSSSAVQRSIVTRDSIFCVHVASRPDMPLGHSS